ncbi:MAG: archaeosortase A, partial [Thermoplasmata archaeon]
AQQTVWVLNAFGYSYGVGDINFAGNPLWYRMNYNEISVPVMGSSVALVQACTALQSMLIFAGAIYCVEAKKKSKWQAFLATVPVIYVLNLVRNVSVIYMIDDLGWGYEFSHHTVGKGASFLALLVLAFVAFKLLPQLLENIWGLMDLADRKKEGEAEEEAAEEETTEKEAPDAPLSTKGEHIPDKV